MLHSESFAALAAALATASADFEPITRNRTVTVKLRSGGSYDFTYATLDEIVRSVRPALAKNGLVLVQSEVETEVNVYGDAGVIVDVIRERVMETRLVHSSGEWIANTTPIMVSKDADNAAQAHGSGMTYSRRYGVTALLCIVAEDDDDGNAAGTGEVTRSTATGASRKPGNVISDKQLSLLRVKLDQAGGNEPAACKLFGVESLGLLPKSRMDEAMAEIQKKNPALLEKIAEAKPDKAAATAQAKAAHDKVFGEVWETMMLIRFHLGVVKDPDAEKVAEQHEVSIALALRAAELWNDFSEAEQRALWLAPTNGGWLTTAEREALRATIALTRKPVNKD